MRTYVYIDASNLFYGGEKSLGWRIDYEKLKQYLEDKYQASKIYYFGGVEIHRFPFDYIAQDSVPIREVEKYLIKYITKKKKYLTEAKLILLDRHLKRIRFYIKLEEFGYEMVLKPVKTFTDEEGNTERKANCDVDMAFYMMRDHNAYDRAIFLSGDGDFLPVLKYLKENKKEIIVFSRSPRTAREIKQFAGDKFVGFEYLRELLKF
ncbi:MAG: NYN domain-containing protein [bacterium]|nr:NYN domain-containing protein [bacterium]